MYRFVLLATLILGLTLNAWAVPTVSNVTAAQRLDGTKLVDVYYDLADSLGDWPYVTLKVSVDGGATYGITATAVTGDVKKNMTPGTGKHIVWDPTVDVPDMVGNNFKAQVNASTCTGYAGPMITIPAGSFLMGPRADEGLKPPGGQPQRSVQLSEFRIGKYEVTRAEYAKFIESGGYSTQSYWSTDGWEWKTSNSRTQPGSWASVQTWSPNPGQFIQTGRHPVVGVSYYEAEAYCNWATTLLPQGEPPYHLPTEAQWEKAARWDAATSTSRIYTWGDTTETSRLNCWDDTLYPASQTAPVGSYPSGVSPYGCLDMLGNAQEYVKDWYSETYWLTTPQGGWIDPSGPSAGTDRTSKGESWGEPLGANISCCLRPHASPSYAGDQSGFRLAR